jgi:hypothetical protein
MARKKKAFSGKMGESGEVTFEGLLEKVPTVQCQVPAGKAHSHGKVWAWDFSLFKNLIDTTSTMGELNTVMREINLSYLHLQQHVRKPATQSTTEWEAGNRFEHEKIGLFIEARKHELEPEAMKQVDKDIAELRSQIEASDNRLAEMMAEASGEARNGAELRLELSRKWNEKQHMTHDRQLPAMSMTTPNRLALHYASANDGGAQLLAWFGSNRSRCCRSVEHG